MIRLLEEVSDPLAQRWAGRMPALRRDTPIINSRVSWRSREGSHRERKAPIQQGAGVHKALIVIGCGIVQQCSDEMMCSIGRREDQAIAGLIREARFDARCAWVGAEQCIGGIPNVFMMVTG